MLQRNFKNICACAITKGVTVGASATKNMAEGPDPRDKPLEELEREITCAVCQEVYQQAKLLPCNHYYCSTCIEKMAAASRGRPLHCPECRKETSLPPGGAAALEPAFFVERMKDVYGKLAKAEGKVEAVCEQCSAAQSVAFCRRCGDFICGNCAQSHKKMRAFADHAVVSLEYLKRGGARDLLLKEVPQRKCAEHDKTLKLFCFDCNSLICRDCTIIDHSGHKFEFLKKCAPESRKTLLHSLAPLQKVAADMAGAKKTLVSEEAKVERQKEEVCRSIQQSFDKLKTVLDRRKAELVKKAGSLAQEKRDVLATQKRVLQVAQKEVQLLVEFVERNVEGTSDQDLMSIRTQLATKMEEEEKRHQQLSLEPSAIADIACNLPSPQVIPDDLGSVFVQPTPALVQNAGTFDLGSPVEVSLAAPTASLEDVSVSLKCVADPLSSLEGEVVGNGVSIFSISVTPQVRGRHDLIVKVKDKEIAGSPFRVFVKLPLSQLGRGKLRSIGSLLFPWGVAINNKQQLIVIETGVLGGRKRVTVMTRNGEKVQTIECNHFRIPFGVAVDSDGAIYVTDIDAACLFKFSSNGQLLKTVGGELQKPFSVKIIDNQLYVLDSASQSVKIFDMDCNVVGTIQTKECPGPRDIAPGPEGLYVAGQGKISVYRCAPNGVFIRHLNLSPSSLKLSEFRGVVFDTRCGHNIIASGWYNGVCVFKPSGECVGHVSSDVIPYPAGVTVDEDGFVYVCSYTDDGKVFIL